MKAKVLMSWSSGKDSAWALYQLQQRTDVEVVGLFCTINQEFERVAMHGVRVALLQQQADSIGLPLELLPIPYPCSNEAYEAVMRDFVARAKAQQVEYFAFGDLFLPDVRQYREQKLAETGIKPIFPIWDIPTDELARTMIAQGVKTVLTCVDPKQVSAELAGREFNAELLADLPETADPCGENGEFHSFVFDGPMFRWPLKVQVGEVVTREGFVFADVLPVDG